MGLGIEIKERNERGQVVMLSGELNTDTYRMFEDKLTDLSLTAQALVFDLSQLTYISSMGLSAFFRLKQKVESHNGTIAMVHLQPQIQLVFDTMKVLSDRMFASLEDADDYLDAFLDKVQKGTIKPKQHNPGT